MGVDLDASQKVTMYGEFSPIIKVMNFLILWDFFWIFLN